MHEQDARASGGILFSLQRYTYSGSISNCETIVKATCYSFQWRLCFALLPVPLKHPTNEVGQGIENRNTSWPFANHPQKNRQFPVGFFYFLTLSSSTTPSVEIPRYVQHSANVTSWWDSLLLASLIFLIVSRQARSLFPVISWMSFG